jgi:hypothetical protein
MGLAEFFQKVKAWFINVFGNKKHNNVPVNPPASTDTPVVPTPVPTPTPTPTPTPVPTPEPVPVPDPDPPAPDYSDETTVEQLQHEIDAVEELVDNLAQTMTVEELTLYNDVDPVIEEPVKPVAEPVAEPVKIPDSLLPSNPSKPVVNDVPSPVEVIPLNEQEDVPPPTKKEVRSFRYF